MVLGASFDDEAANKAFAEKYDFPFLLLCDVERDIGVKYGAADNAEASHARRVSYLIGPDGTIAHSYPKVDVASHADQVLADLEAHARSSAG